MIVIITITIPFPKCTINAEIHQFKTKFMWPRSIARVTFDLVRRFRASLLLPLVCVPDVIEEPWASCVEAQQPKKTN